MASKKTPAPDPIEEKPARRRAFPDGPRVSRWINEPPIEQPAEDPAP